MRSLTWMGVGLGLVGLALVAPTAARAGQPTSSAPSGAKARPRRPMFQKAHLCARCQWSELRAKGIDAPPPPPMPLVQGGMVATDDRCDRCGAPVAATGPSGLVVAPLPAPAPPPAMAYDAPMAPTAAPMMTSHATSDAPCVQCAAAGSTPVMLGPDGAPMMVADGGMPGRAVAGGAGAGAVPGYVVVGGTVPLAEPTPIGVIQGRYAYQNPGAGGMGMGMGMPMPMPGARPGPGPGASAGRGAPGTGDASVMPSSFSSDPITAGASGRPHVLTHLFGIDALGARGREERERRKRENHAAVSYEQQAQQVSELPTSMVYGR